MNLRTAGLAPACLLLAGLAACAHRAPPVPESAVRPVPAPMQELAPLEAPVLSSTVQAAVPLAGGLLALLGQDRSLVLLRAPSREVARATVPGEADCQVLPWGARAVVLCPSGREIEAFTLAEGGSLAVAGRLRERPLVGHEGRTLTLAGPCEPGGEQPSQQGVACTFHTARDGWREWQFPGRGTVLDVYDGLALIAVQSAGVEAPADVRLFDIDHATWLASALADPTAVWLRAGFSADGRVVGLVRRGQQAGRCWFLEGEAGTAPLLHEWSTPLDDLASPGEGRVLVAGAGSAALTSDAGRAFRRVQAAAWPAPGRTDPALPRPAGERVRCNDDVCVLDGRVLITLPAAAADRAP